MVGFVQAGAAAFPTSRHGVVLISQCQPCGGKSGTYTDWAALTNDGGRLWSVRKESIPADVGTPLAFANATDGWIGNGDATHDGGQTWHRVPSAAGVSSVSIANSTTWAIGTPCASNSCGPVILRGAASGNALRRTANQPISGYAGNIVAADADTAYLDAFGNYGEIRFATHDGGRSWRTVAEPCPAGYFATYPLTAGGPDSLWQVCQSGRHVPGSPHLKPIPGKISSYLSSRSVDGGRTWHSTGDVLPRGGLVLHPVSSTVAWGDGIDSVYRSSTAGRMWTQVFTPASFRLRGAVGQPVLEVLDASSPTAAEAVLAVPVRSGTELVVAYTSDAGRSWRPRVIALPTG